VNVANVIHTPGYLLRRRIVLHCLRGEAPGRLLEIGCGRGDLLAQLAARGWTGTGLEISPEAADVARQALAPHGARVRVVGDPREVAETYPLVLATEVLEHVEKDAAELRRWREWVAPGGRLLLTVPAHARYWTTADEFVGHYRRYERGPLRRLVNEAGFEVEQLWSFGFPLTAATVPLRGLAYRRRIERVRALGRDARGLGSSFDSTRAVRGGAALAQGMEALGLAFHLLQLPFVRTDLGASYLVSCRRTGVEKGQAS
jgi:SAM-dependent methyltransferase